MVCCNGQCCTSCSVTLFVLGIRTCGQKSLFGLSTDYYCVDCDDCNGQTFPLVCPSDDVSEATVRTVKKNIPNPNLINRSYSNTEIYLQRRGYMKQELEKLSKFVVFVEPIGSNIQFFVQVNCEGYKKIAENLSGLSLNMFEKEILIKRLISSILNVNNINLIYNVYLNLKRDNVNFLGKEDTVNKFINLNLENFILNVLINSSLQTTMNSLSFDEVFEILYSYLITFINIFKVLITKSTTCLIKRILVGQFDCQINCDVGCVSNNSNDFNPINTNKCSACKK